MVAPFCIADHVNETEFLSRAVAATSVDAISALLSQLPIVDEQDYIFDRQSPEKSWISGKLHWYPVGGDRGNGGRIKLGGIGENPIGERLINSMEGLIEHQRQLELLTTPDAPPPESPRAAVKRYFDLPPLDQLPSCQSLLRRMKPKKYAREVAKYIRVKLIRTENKQYAVLIEDDGIGQVPSKLHSTLLSLGSSDKADKPYLIGVFGQGGSSAYHASAMSWLVSRREHKLTINEQDQGVGWTVVKHVFPKGRRDDYFAYLAATPDGTVPAFSAKAADAANISHGTRIAHVNYDFGKSEPARTLYVSLNHLLFNPVLPYELTTGPNRTPDPMWGNAYRLSNLHSEQKSLDKTFEPQSVASNK